MKCDCIQRQFTIHYLHVVTVGTIPSYVPVVEIDKYFIGMLQLVVLLGNFVAMMVRYVSFRSFCNDMFIFPFVFSVSVVFSLNRSQGGWYS